VISVEFRAAELEKVPQFGYRIILAFEIIVLRIADPRMVRTIPAAADSSGDPIACPPRVFSGTASAASGPAIRTGILWMLTATCLFVCQDSTSRILLRTYAATEIAFVRYLVHMVLVAVFLTWHDPRLMISRRPALQLLRSIFLLCATLFAMLALKIMPLVDFSAIVWVAPVLVAALSIFMLNEKVSPGLWASVFAGLTGVWVIIGRTDMDFSLSMLFPFLAALANALYQITTRLLHGSDSSLTTLFYTAVAGVVFCGGFLPFVTVTPNMVDAGLMLLLGLFGVTSHFCLIRAFAAAPANVVAPFGYSALLWAVLFSLLIFREIPSPRTLFGAALIVGAGLFIFLRSRKT
jgi:drug/metabolite transporter (DMT)-like permease